MQKQEIFEIVVRHAREVIPTLASHPFKITDALRDLGANSIDRSEISMLALESLALRVPLVELAHAQNISDLVDILYAKQPPS
jgi:polyketide biosynthesis acyl carrier protein